MEFAVFDEDIAIVEEIPQQLQGLDFSKLPFRVDPYSGEIKIL